MENAWVRLEPLRVRHAEELWPAVDDDEIRRFWPRRWQDQADVESQFRHLIDRRERGVAEPFLIRDRAGAAVGSTAFYGISKEHRHLSIGWTFLVPSVRGTAVNPATKSLLLAEAFDGRRMERVELHVDSRNTRSRTAVAKLGAMQEGVLRRHRVLWDGYVRDTVMFSIVKDQWPEVKAGLEKRLDAFRAVPDGGVHEDG